MGWILQQPRPVTDQCSTASNAYADRKDGKYMKANTS